MDRQTAAHLELKGEVGKIDSGAVDWKSKVVDVALKILAAILTLLLMAGVGVALDVLIALMGFPFGLG
ncbi:hypothetical protein [Gemmata sp.]|uniref:hypothetical protein n=1 Tax=Gemmata sp. TaxID=1914242 RepID=UPI003F727CFA